MSFKVWNSLSLLERQRFSTKFVQNYKKLYPGSKTNVSLNAMIVDMATFRDVPAVFQVFYNDISKLHMSETLNRNTYGRFSHPSFVELLYKEK
ncbi:hypothetical protein ACO0RG_000500 [Hanseniaspora osmophila]|uniref:Uncharacterized protein n=1 Tax=Hanseniaspora osmophila TaxID=56408 RepID=A0A1E5R2M5_9ASCO|nr:Uncharacterized protein AWRI3579_g4263 [Hanseniaspora osmophila]